MFWDRATWSNGKPTSLEGGGKEERERVPQFLATWSCGLGSIIFLFPSLFQIL